jgi:predicted DNA-binding transcriptional regulator AlpA
MELEALRQGLAGAIRGAGPEDLPGLIGLLAEIEALAQLALKTANDRGSESARDDKPETNLSAAEAARRLGMSRDWLYKNASSLPFAVRIGRRLLFDAKGLERWNRGRTLR